MLKQSVLLNFSIVESLVKKLKMSVYFTLCTFMFFSFCFLPRDRMLVASVAIAAVGTGIALGIFVEIFRVVFHQSLFGEDAYTYMLFPLSSKSMVWGKVITTGYYLLWSLLIFSVMWFLLYYWWRDLEYGVISWDLKVIEQLTEDIVGIGKMLFGQRFGAGAVTFIIGAAVLQVVLVCAMICSEIQLCVILNHIYNPNGKKKYIRILLTLGVVVDLLLCLYLPIKIFCLLSDGFITILPLAVTMVLELLLTVVYGKSSVMLLETEYELN